MTCPAQPRPAAGGSIPYELRIGVTGHRDLPNPQAIEVAVRSLLQGVVHSLTQASADPHGPYGSPQKGMDSCDRWIARGLGWLTRRVGPLLDLLAGEKGGPLYGLFGASHWPRVPVSPEKPDDGQKTPLKLTIVSSLARGADQVVAGVVCSMVPNPGERNRYLEAVLPFPQAVYEQDFTEASDLEAFRSLLRLDCGRENTHPDPTVAFPDFPRHLDATGEVRTVTHEEAYAEAGRFVVDTSEIVVAVWDPTRPMKPGGTEATIRYALGCSRIVLWVNPAGLATGRLVLRKNVGDAEGVGAPLARHDDILVFPVPERAKQLSENFHRLAAYNRDGAVNSARLADEERHHRNRLEEVAATHPIPSAVREVLLGVLLPYFARADHLGSRYRELRNFSARLWPTTAALLVSIMAFQIIFLPGSFWAAWIELAVLSLCYVSYRVSVYDGWHDKWLNDRRLAEGLRAAMFTALVRSTEDLTVQRARASHLPGPFGYVQNPLPFYSAATTWFVATLKRELAKQRRRFAGSLDLSDTDQCRALAGFLRQAWIQHQIDHHAVKAKSRRKMARTAGVIRHGLVLAIALVATAHAIGLGHGGHDSWSPFARVDLWIAFATVVLPAWAAAFHVMSSLDDHERMAERSTRMVSLLGALADRLKDVQDADQLNACVDEAERVLDLESLEWAESLTDRRPEFTA